jgi:hypothetical protein
VRCPRRLLLRCTWLFAPTALCAGLPAHGPTEGLPKPLTAVPRRAAGAVVEHRWEWWRGAVGGSLSDNLVRPSRGWRARSEDRLRRDGQETKPARRGVRLLRGKGAEARPNETRVTAAGAPVESYRRAVARLTARTRRCTALPTAAPADDQTTGQSQQREAVPPHPRIDLLHR